MFQRLLKAFQKAFQRKPLQVTKKTHTAYPEIIPGDTSCVLRIYDRATSRLMHHHIIKGKTLESAKGQAQKKLRELMAQYEVK